MIKKYIFIFKIFVLSLRFQIKNNTMLCGRSNKIYRFSYKNLLESKDGHPEILQVFVLY